MHLECLTLRPQLGRRAGNMAGVGLEGTPEEVTGSSSLVATSVVTWSPPGLFLGVPSLSLSLRPTLATHIVPQPQVSAPSMERIYQKPSCTIISSWT